MRMVRALVVSTALVALATVGYGVRRFFLDREKQRLEQDKHVTDRFSSAVGHLNSDDETVRAGGIRTASPWWTDTLNVAPDEVF